MAFIIIRVDSFENANHQAYKIELKENQTAQNLISQFQNWFEKLPENDKLKKLIGNSCFVYSAGIFETAEIVDQELNKHFDWIKKQKELINRLKPKKSPIVAIFPDGISKEFPDRKTFLEYLNIPSSYSSSINEVWINHAVPLKSKKYPQLNDIVLRKTDNSI